MALNPRWDDFSDRPRGDRRRLAFASAAYAVASFISFLAPEIAPSTARGDQLELDSSISLSVRLMSAR